MKNLSLFVVLCALVLFFAKVLEYVFEYYEIHWTSVEIG